MFRDQTPLKSFEPETRTGYRVTDKSPLLPVGPQARRGDPAMDEKKMSEDVPQSASRRNFIKGVVAAGAVASSSAYLFRGATVHGQPAAGAVERLITLNVNGQ